MEEKTLLIKKITFKHVFYFIYSKKNINSTKHVFFLNKNYFSKFSFQTQFFFFWKHKKLFLKTVLKNCFKKQQPNMP